MAAAGGTALRRQSIVQTENVCVPSSASWHPRLRGFVASKFLLQWSPEQISGWLRCRFPSNGRTNVSHETVYFSLFHTGARCAQEGTRGTSPLPSLMRKSKKASAEASPRGQIVDAFSICERPSKTEQCPATGKATSSQDEATARRDLDHAERPRPASSDRHIWSS